MIGTRVGNWLITEEIGDGGHAFVFKGVNASETAAVKMLKPSVAGEDNLARRFQVEADALSNLHHPAIVGFFDYLFVNNYHYLVMEYMDGGAVDHFLRASGPMEPRYALPIIYRVLDGLIYAHSFGYIHRDIKPNNILINRMGEAKLTDFGIAKVVGGETLTRRGFVVGTTPYMAPEYLSQGVVTPQTDIYAVGATLYEMLTNRLPFEHDSSKENLVDFVKRMCTDDPPPPSGLRPIPQPLERIVMRAIDRDPKKRYRTVERLKNDLRKAFPELVERPIEVPEAGRVQTRLWGVEAVPEAASGTAEAANRGRSANPTVVITAAVLLGVAAGLVTRLLLGWANWAAAVAAVAIVGLTLGLGVATGSRRGGRGTGRRSTSSGQTPREAARETGATEGDDGGDGEDDAGGEVFQETEVSELQAFLVCTAGPSRGRRWGLRPVSRIGRDLRFDIRPKDPEISRCHAMLTFNGTGFVLKDMGSTNGTYLNEERLPFGTERALRHGDIVRIGRTSMRYERQS